MLIPLSLMVEEKERANSIQVLPLFFSLLRVPINGLHFVRGMAGGLLDGTIPWSHLRPPQTAP